MRQVQKGILVKNNHSAVKNVFKSTHYVNQTKSFGYMHGRK